MFMSAIFSLFMAMSISIIMSSSPINLMIWILIMSLMMTTFVALMFSPWFGLIIFIIYIGGMLVMFSYFTAIQPNLQIKIKPMFIYSFLTFIIMPSPLYTNSMTSFFTKYVEIWALLMPLNLPVIMLIVLILFLALVAVVKISFFSMGPLRPFNIYV